MGIDVEIKKINKKINHLSLNIKAQIKFQRR